MKDPITNIINLQGYLTCSICFCPPLLGLEEKLPFTLDKDVCVCEMY